VNLTAHDYIWIGTLAATILYLRKDVNGLGMKTRRMIAEMIITAGEEAGIPKENRPRFEGYVRRLLG
jgi:hypothetical protein